MKTVKLTIQLQDKEPGAVIEMDDNIARHFIRKGWATEYEGEPDPVIEPVKKVKVRPVVGQKIVRK